MAQFYHLEFKKFLTYAKYYYRNFCYEKWNFISTLFDFTKVKVNTALILQ